MREAKPEEGTHFLRLKLKDKSPEERLKIVRNAVEDAARDIFPTR
jgi:hypothetical protein